MRRVNAQHEQGRRARLIDTVAEKPRRRGKEGERGNRVRPEEEVKERVEVSKSTYVEWGLDQSCWVARQRCSCDVRRMRLVAQTLLRSGATIWF